MNRPAAQAILGAVSLIAVTVAIVSDLGRTAPGELAAIHERVPELVGRSGCDVCHGESGSLMAQSCLACHEVVGAQLIADEGLHGALDQAVSTECGLCHGEHHGPEFQPAGAIAFAIAGVPDSDLFDHAMLGVEMEGEHQSLECTKCHANAEMALPPPGEPRFGGLQWQCASCHDDPHEGVFGERCASCHGQTDFTDPSNFTHDERFPLVGAHAARDCAECHPTEGAHSFRVLSQAVPQLPARECVGCHDNPHAASFVNASAALAQATPGNSCATCHSTEQANFGAGAEEFHSEQHAASGFPLEVPHDQLECESCHTADATFQERFPGRSAEECAECHEDPHAGEFEQGAFAAQGCLGCHAGTHFAPHEFDAQLHELTAFPLTGSHLELDCKECHSDLVAPERGGSSTAHQVASFQNAPVRCEDCHTDVHRGAFAVASAGLAPESEGQCAQCHDTESFHNVAADGFDHGSWTDFPLEGAHQRAACDTCHTRSATPDASGRTLGYVADHVNGSLTACASCHEDPHEGAFDDSALPAAAAAANDLDGCARCHGTETFADTAETFDHGLWTGFGLEGAHAKSDCMECHPRLDAPRPSGRAYAFAADHFGGEIEGCAPCHQDPHAQAFDGFDRPTLVEGRASCARCHDALSFAGAAETFEHSLWTEFALDGAHAHAGCLECHPALDAPTPAGRVHATAVEQFGGEIEGCASCHQDPHWGEFDQPGQPVQVEGRYGCARCHGTGSFRTLQEDSFDHGFWTGFALDGGHVDVSCSSCHTASAHADELGRTYAAATGTRCADCHADPHAGQFRAQGQSADCDRCHGKQSLEDLTFDHQTDSRFKLDESHVELACAACHKPWPLPGGGSVVRYRPLGRECTDCHGVGGGKRRTPK